MTKISGTFEVVSGGNSDESSEMNIENGTRAFKSVLHKDEEDTITIKWKGDAPTFTVAEPEADMPNEVTEEQENESFDEIEARENIKKAEVENQLNNLEAGQELIPDEEEQEKPVTKVAIHSSKPKHNNNNQRKPINNNQNQKQFKKNKYKEFKDKKKGYNNPQQAGIPNGVRVPEPMFGSSGLNELFDTLTSD